jgi:hypothetical protein
MKLIKLTALTESTSELLKFSDFVSDFPEEYQQSLLNIGRQLFKLGYEFDQDEFYGDEDGDARVNIDITKNGQFLVLTCEIQQNGMFTLTYTFETNSMNNSNMAEIIAKICAAGNALDDVKGLLPASAKLKFQEETYS